MDGMANLAIGLGAAEFGAGPDQVAAAIRRAAARGPRRAPFDIPPPPADADANGLKLRRLLLERLESGSHRGRQRQARRATEAARRERGR